MPPCCPRRWSSSSSVSARFPTGSVITAWETRWWKNWRQLLRHAQAGESTEELVEKVRAMAHWDAYLWEREGPK